MHFLRFGSSIPGSYWGCCAVCIIQDFHRKPTDPASIELVDGDGGYPICDMNGETMFYGKTYEEIFRQRIRTGTFSRDPMPNHVFFAILTAGQITGSNGQAWLKILKEEGFEFVRTTSNSVYDGSKAAPADKEFGSKGAHPNYIFALFRNIGNGGCNDTFTPPKEWTDLDKVVDEAWEAIPDRKALTESQRQTHLELWNKLPPFKTYTRKELEEAKVPVILAGKRSENPQEPAEAREAREKKKASAAKTPAPAPFAA